MSNEPLAAGQLVQEYARRMGWPVRRHNIFVEGAETRYFKLAAGLYEKETGVNLIDPDLSIFPVGDGDNGGTIGLMEHFPTFMNLARIDVGPDAKLLYRAIAVLDDDYAGQNAFNHLTSSNVSLVASRDVFLLKRVMPRSTRDTRSIEKQTRQLNEPWKRVDCEIEDLLARSLIEAFVAGCPKSLKRPPSIVGNGHHFEFSPGVKPQLARFAEEHAMVEDVLQIVRALDALRYYVGLPAKYPEGL